jgi:hypothetical protein
VEHALIKRFGLGIFPLFVVKAGQPVQRISYLRMFRTQRLFTDSQCSLIERFGLGIFPLFIVEECQVVGVATWVATLQLSP